MSNDHLKRKAPTPAAHSRWWAATAPYVSEFTRCAWCGGEGSKHYTQPQHPFWAQKAPGGERMEIDAYGLARIDGVVVASCAGCIDAHNRQAKADRKATLDAQARCEVDACKRRGAYTTYGTLVCGAHLKRIKVAHHKTMAGAGGIGLFLPPPRYTKADILRMARGNQAVCGCPLCPQCNRPACALPDCNFNMAADHGLYNEHARKTRPETHPAVTTSTQDGRQ